MKKYKRIVLPEKFKNFGPYLPDVKIIETFGYHDGPLDGICIIENIEFYFSILLYDMSRYYDKKFHDRLWAIYQVHDLDVSMIKDDHNIVYDKDYMEYSETIGIFWDYKYDS